MLMHVEQIRKYWPILVVTVSDCEPQTLFDFVFYKKGKYVYKFTHVKLFLIIWEDVAITCVVAACDKKAPKGPLGNLGSSA